MVAKAFCFCCFAQQALSLTVSETDMGLGLCGCDFRNPDEGELEDA